MKELEFYNLKTKKKFKTTDYFLEERFYNNTAPKYFAITTSPEGVTLYRIVSKDFYLANKK